MRDNRRTCVKASHSCGKCVAATDIIPLADGRRVAAADLIGRYFAVVTFHQDGRQAPALAWATDNGSQPTVAITLDDGTTLTRTREHPLWAATITRPNAHINLTDIGWRAAADIRAGDVILAPIQHEASGRRPLPDHHVKLMGYLLGDAGTTRAVSFHQQAGPAKDDFLAIANALGCRITQKDAITLDVTGPSPEAFLTGSNPALNLAREWGLYPCKSKHKRLPPQAWELPNEQLALLLNRYFACDGWAYGHPANNAAEIAFTTASEGLAHDLHAALHRLGIHGKIRPRHVRLGTHRFPAWTWRITTLEAMEQFVNTVGILGKEEALHRALETVRRRSSKLTRKWQTFNCPPGYHWSKVLTTADAGTQPTVSITVPKTHTFITSAVEHNTWMAAMACNWWMDCWDRHIAYITAPTWNRALNLCFKEVRRQRHAARLPGEILETGIVRPKRGVASLDHFIQALNAEKGEGFQGEHSAPILIVIEEAVGVPAYIWAAANGLMTHPECRVLAIANPTDEANAFGTACANPTTHTLTMSALDHPNIDAELRCEPAPFPDAVRLLWLYEMLRDECLPCPLGEPESFDWWSLPAIDQALAGTPITPHSPRTGYRPNALFQGRAQGDFPSQPAQQVIPPAWLANLPTLDGEGLPQIGCDPARFGEDTTAIAVAWGPKLLSLTELRRMDTVAVADALRDSIVDTSAATGCPITEIPVLIDTTGGLGAGPADTLFAEGYDVRCVCFSDQAIDPTTYPNRRSELWFTLRERAREKNLDLSALAPDMLTRLKRELSTPRYKIDSAGRKVVDSKDVMKAKLGASPDRAEAVNLAFAYEPKRGARPFALAPKRESLAADRPRWHSDSPQQTGRAAGHPNRPFAGAVARPRRPPE